MSILSVHQNIQRTNCVKLITLNRKKLCDGFLLVFCSVPVPLHLFLIFFKLKNSLVFPFLGFEKDAALSKHIMRLGDYLCGPFLVLYQAYGRVTSDLGHMASGEGISGSCGCTPPPFCWFPSILTLDCVLWLPAFPELPRFEWPQGWVCLASTAYHHTKCSASWFRSCVLTTLFIVHYILDIKVDRFLP